MVLYTCVRFHENISNSFQLTEQTGVHGGNGYVQYSKGNNSKSRQTRGMVHCFCTFSHDALHCVMFRENITNGISHGAVTRTR